MIFKTPSQRPWRRVVCVRSGLPTTRMRSMDFPGFRSIATRSSAHGPSRSAVAWTSQVSVPLLPNPLTAYKKVSSNNLTKRDLVPGRRPERTPPPRELLCRSRRGSRVLLAAVLPPLLLGLALHLAALRPGLLVARLAGLLRGPCPGAIVPPFVPPLHTLRLRGRGTDAQHHQRRDHGSGALAYETLSHTRLLCAATLAAYVFRSRTLEQEPVPAGPSPRRTGAACARPRFARSRKEQHGDSRG